MKKIIIALIGLILLPSLALAVSSNSQSSSSSGGSIGSGVSTGPATSTSSTNSTSSSPDLVGNDANSSASSQSRSQNQAQTQTNNPETGTMTQEQAQIQTEEETQSDIKNSQPQYTPKNSNGIAHRSVVANAVQAMLQVANKTENQGIGQQIKVIAQTQSQNQDKINQAIDKAETRSGFAKFFIGANYKELKSAQEALEQNKIQIQDLENLMNNLTTDADKLEIANQIIALQSEQYEIRNQVSDLSSGFSLFGWIARWKNGFSL